jgi:hypothetical protein
LTQKDLGAVAGVSQSAVSRTERGHFDTLALWKVRRIFSAVDATAEIEIRWRGGEADRLLDEQHAELLGAAAAILRRCGWKVFSEVTYSVYGERGSVDLLGVHEATRSAAVIEGKTEVASAEEAQRRFDVKCRLAPDLVRERVGWRPRHLGRILLVTDTKTNRRRIQGLSDLLSDGYPARTTQVSRWLRSPTSDLGGIWFLSASHGGTGSPATGGPKRVRRPPGAVSMGPTSVDRASGDALTATGPVRDGGRPD